MYNKSVLKTEDGKELTNFSQGISCYQCTDVAGNDKYISIDELKAICNHNGIEFCDLLPDYSTLIEEYHSSDFSDLDEWLNSTHPNIVLERWERDDFIK